MWHLLLTIIFIKRLICTSSTPLFACNPSVEVILVSPIITTGVSNTLTFSKAYTATPSLIPSIVSFQAATNYTTYNLFIVASSGSSLTTTGYIFNLTAGATVWTQVSVSFLAINSSSQQFALMQTITTTSVNTTGASKAKDIFYLTMGSINTLDNTIIMAFNQGFLISRVDAVPLWFRPGFLLDFGIFSSTSIWFSIQSVYNTVISNVALEFLLIDTTTTSKKIYLFDKQTAFISSYVSNITISSVPYYNQYCFMAGLTSFVFNFTVVPQFTFTYPTFTLTTTLSASVITANFSINVTTVNLYAATCVTPNIYYLQSTNLCYDSCPEPYYASGLYCLRCHYTCKNCTSSTACATCLDTFGSTQTLNGDYCNCNTGYFDNSATCQLCNTSCVNCSVSWSNCTACSTGFYVNNTNCIEICGDGLLYNFACDDGNTISGDGCSSTCMIEENYTCINGSATTPSVCSYNQPFQLTFMSSSQTDSNTVYIALQIFPQMMQFSNLNFSQYFSANLNYSTLTCTYSNSSLNFFINFTEPLSSSYSKLTLTFNPPTSSSYNFAYQSSSVIIPYGEDVILYYQSSLKVNSIIKIILIVIESLSFLALIIIYRKAAALQYIMVLQIVSLSTTYIDANCILILTFKYLHQIGINGSNSIFNSITSSLPVQNSISRLGYSPQLYLNLNLMLIIPITLVLVSLVLYIIQSKVDPPHSERIQKITSYTLQQIVPTLILFNLINLSFGIGQTAYAYLSIDPDLFDNSHIAANISILLINLLMLTIVCEYYRADKQNTILISWKNHYNNTKQSYLQFIIWIMFKFITGLIMGLCHNFTNSLIVLIILTIAYMLFVLISKPFKTLLLALQHLYSQLILLALFAILIFYRYSLVNQLSSNGMVPTIILLVLILIGVFIVSVYAGYSLSKNIKYWMKKAPRTKLQKIQSHDNMTYHFEEINQIKRQSRLKARKKLASSLQSNISVGLDQ